ncbi:MAG: OmpP1/FadL family transporter, partial [Chitinophagales bacterium]
TLSFSETESTYQDDTNIDNFSNFNVGNLGVVFSNNKYREGKNWKAVNFALGYNRIQNFHNRSIIGKDGSSSSLTDAYAEDAQGIAEADLLDELPFGGGMAYWTYLIDPVTDTEYVSALPNNIDQRELTTTKGAVDEFLMAMAGNYKDKLYIGATIGIPVARYTQEKIFRESDESPSTDFESFQLSEYLETRGIGINAKFGATYRIDETFRVGAAVHTPTLMSFDENFDSVLSSEFANDSFTEESPFGSFAYDLKTPWKAILSASAVIGKKGFISADYEFMDYSNMEFTYDSNDSNDRLFFSDLNQEINQTFQSTSNLRVGGELALDIFRIRAGFAYYGTPFINGESSTARKNITAGFGIRGKDLYADLGYVYTFYDSFYQPYTLSDRIVPSASLKNSAANLALTVGFRF